MSNAPESIKALADGVTAANIEDGVAVALAQYVLGGAQA